jgi:hypothetical protein
MFAQQNRLRLVVYTLATIALGAGIWSAAPRSRASDEPDAKLTSLLKERLEVLRAVVERTKAAYQAGATGFTKVYEAQLAALRAELDMCSTDEARTKVLEQMIAVAKKNEETIEARSGFSGAGSSDVLNARASRLSLEIELERLRTKTR